MLDDKTSWFALYTRPRHEKKVADLLNEKGIEAYVPMSRTLKQWSDRRKWIEEPLIRSYCFVRAYPHAYFETLNTPGAVRYVWFNGKAAQIPDRQITLLKVLTNSEHELEAIPANLKPGRQVRIIAGTLAGTIGEMITFAGKKRVIIRIDHLKTMISVTISPALLEVLPGEYSNTDH